MTDWKLYRGDGQPRNVEIPPAPPWRRFNTASPDQSPDGGSSFRTTPEMVEAVNAALYLRRPLLLTGKPGSGKSSLIDAVARELRLGPVLRWHITSRSTLQDALYRYDAIGRLHAERIEDTSEPITNFLRLGPLGTSLLPGPQPRALLIDEIDKSDIDLPNDLLNVFERGEFEVPELARMKDPDVPVRQDGSNELVTIRNGKIRCQEFPFVIMTSNGERDFPSAFLRRCIRLQIPEPSPQMLAEIVTAHLGSEAAEIADDLIMSFSGDRAQRATDQLLNAVYMVTHQLASDSDERERVIQLVLKQLVPES